jgi:DNA polymerase III gamma/tau subunit
VLEKALASSTDKKLTREETEKATGAPRHALVHALALALSKGDQEKALETIRAVSEQEIDMQLYLALVLEYLRQVLLIRHAPELGTVIRDELGEDAAAEATALADAPDSKLTHETLKRFLEASSRMRFSPVPSLPLELAVMELGQ